MKKHNLPARAKIVLPLAVMQIVAWGSIYTAFPLFIEPIHKELNWSTNAITGAMSLGLLTSAAVQLGLGRILERLGACQTMAAGALCAAAAMVLASSSNSLSCFYSAWIMPEEFEGNVGALLLLSGATSAIFVPLTYALIDGVGWRKTLLLFSVFNIAAALLATCLARTVRRTPAQAGASRRGHVDAADAKNFRRTVLGTFRFWMLALAFAANLFALTALVNQLPAILVSQKSSMHLTLAALGIIGPAQAAGRLVQLGLARRISYPLLAGTAFGLFSAGAVGLQFFTSSGAMVLISITAIGLGSGIITSVRSTIAATLFDRRFYARLSGVMAAPASLARAAGPFAGALVASSVLAEEGVLDMVSATALVSLWMFLYALSRYRTARN